MKQLMSAAVTPVRIEQLSQVASGRAGAEIDVFYFDLDHAAIEGELSDAHENATCQRFVSESLRRRYRQSHLVKRTILGSYLDAAPQSLKFVRGKFDKPYLDVARLQFNLSHSQGWGALAVSEQEIGIDCESIRPFIDCDELAPSISHPDERIVGRHSFYRSWTRKEAAMKQLGLGFQLEPRKLRVSNSPEAVEQWQPSMIDERDDAPTIRDLAAPDSLFAALAAATADSVRVFRLIRPDPTAGGHP